MTREEAIKRLESIQIYMDTFEDEAAMEIAIRVLRPVTREQVVKVWRGCALCNWGGLDYVGVDGDGIYLSKPTEDEKFRFCPVCGKPLTDEAVEMVMERLEALQCGN